MKKRLPPRLKKFPAAKQRRLDALLDKNSEGRITTSERSALEALVAEAERLMTSNAKRLAEFSASETASPPGEAVPVTVWVKPETVR
jgi:hypothetical protein